VAKLPPLTQDIIARTKWYVYIRWYLLLAIALPGILSLYIVDGWTAELRRDLLLGLFAISTNGIFYLLIRFVKNPKAFYAVAISLVSFDVFLVSVLIFINGGIESRNAILYVFPILFSAAIFGRRGIYVTTASSIFAYDFIIIGSYLNIIPAVGYFDPTIHSRFGYVVNTVAFFSSVLVIIGVAVDFITRLLGEKEVQASESLRALKHAQSIAKFGSWEWDINKDKVFWSEELCRMFGINSSDGHIDYKNYIKALHPEDRELATNAISKALKNHKSFSFDHRVIRPNGTIRYLRGNGQPVMNDKGKVIKLIGTAQDITQAKRLEEARHDFVALASHQLRTPATAVKQYLSLLIEGYAGSLTDDQKSFARIAYESNDQQLSIVDDLLNVAQVDSGNLKLRLSPADLVSLINALVKENALKFENKKQILIFDTTYKKLMHDVDARRLFMALDNILDNAHKYTPKNGRVKIKLVKNRGNILISITDDGIGIAKKDISNIFKKFARVNSPETRLTEGTGLGLYITHRIVKLHGGNIETESTPKKGTKFKVFLPLKK
jgi:PAS domain S-box-containing protein